MLTIKPGRYLAPFSSANTNLTRTSSPRLQLVIRGILGIVPKCRQHGISAAIERDQTGSRDLVDQNVFQASLNSFPDAGVLIVSTDQERRTGKGSNGQAHTRELT